MVNPNAGQEGQNAFVPIDKADAFEYKGGRMTADDLKSKYVQGITGTDYSARLAEDESPDIEGSAVPQAINAETPLMNGEQFDPSSVMNGSPADMPYNLTDAPAFTDKDRSGRYNRFI